MSPRPCWSEHAVAIAASSSCRGVGVRPSPTCVQQAGTRPATGPQTGTRSGSAWKHLRVFEAPECTTCATIFGRRLRAAGGQPRGSPGSAGAQGTGHHDALQRRRDRPARDCRQPDRGVPRNARSARTHAPASSAATWPNEGPRTGTRITTTDRQSCTRRRFEMGAWNSAEKRARGSRGTRASSDGEPARSR